MGFIFNLLTFPILGPPKLAYWLARTLHDAAWQELLDEGQVRGALLELQERYDAGHMSEGEYDTQERELLGRLSYIREVKAQERQRG